MVEELAGSVALVTGATAGIGRAVARRLAAAGAEVVVHGRDEGRGQEVVTEIEKGGGHARFVAADLTDAADVRRLAAAAGDVSILVNNAGVYQFGATADVTDAVFDAHIDLNLRAPFLLAQAVVPDMREQRYGRIVLLSSVAAFLGGILSPQYTASKAGLIGLAHSLAATLAPHGITVNAIAPGLIMTDMLAGDPRLETLERSVPVGRLGQPAEVADVIVAVPRNAYMTGQTVSVDGGRYPR